MLGTKVKPKSICGSACFFIWSAGWTRNAGHTYLVNFYGRVGLHRPYLKNPSTDSNSIQYQTALQNQIKKYLSDNLIPARLVDAMMARPSNDVYWLTQQDLKELGKHPAPLEELFINKCQYDRRHYDLLSDLQVTNRLIEAEQLEKKIDSIYDCILDIRFEIKSKNMREFIFKNELKYSKQNTEKAANNDDAIEIALVNRIHPGWQKTVATRQFAAWLERQPVEIRQLADSVRALDAIKLLDLYKVDINSTPKVKR